MERILLAMAAFLLLSAAAAEYLVLPKLQPGFTVETVFDLKKYSANAFSLYPRPNGRSLLALDSTGSRIFQLDLPLSQNSSFKLFAGSATAETGFVDGPASTALFNHPQSLTVVESGDVYVADTRNFAVRKISNGQVTTIAGGDSLKAGYVDGPGETARFSNEISLSYWCGVLLIADRGNQLIREIQVDSKVCSPHNFTLNGSKGVWLVISMMISCILCGFAVGVYLPKIKNLIRSPGQAVNSNSLWIMTTWSTILCFVCRSGIARALFSLLFLVWDLFTLNKPQPKTTPNLGNRQFELLQPLFQARKIQALPDLIDFSEDSKPVSPVAVESNDLFGYYLEQFSSKKIV